MRIMWESSPHISMLGFFGRALTLTLILTLQS